MSRIVLINSPIYRNPTNETESYLPPLGLGYIATALHQAGHTVSLLDAVFERKGTKEVLESLCTRSSDYIGVNLFTQNYHIVKEIVEQCPPCCGLIIGGQVVKSIYQEILSWETQSPLYIIIGEGEKIIPAIIDNKCTQTPLLQQELKFVYAVTADSEYFPKDISQSPLNYDFFKNSTNTNYYGDVEGTIITSRGCPHNCAFCGGAKSLNPDTPIRHQSLSRSTQDIVALQKLQPSLKCIRILDDLFLANTTQADHAIALFEQFPALYWRSMIHALSLKDNLSRITDLHSAGCRELFMGIESGSQQVRNHIHKTGTVEDILSTAEVILESGIHLKGYFIYGFPQESEDDFRLTYQLAEKLAQLSKKTPGTFRSSVFQFRPYHGTQLYNEIFHSQSNVPAMISGLAKSGAGRAQFNFISGNYSNTSDEVIIQYIEKTQQLTGGDLCCTPMKL